MTYLDLEIIMVITITIITIAIEANNYNRTIIIGDNKTNKNNNKNSYPTMASHKQKCRDYTLITTTDPNNNVRSVS